ncbi:hypothetical protein P7K49_015289 [Saguinus oedipus]|uniref:AJAP1/PANP C-terminal domain-containing protein n=1 Tax=Saguinus oedipus TaxID=9490 RepID=A0ABQ9V9B9_SAGOE|nr:hypothetical protein P7K49_015289 [Saguinus oedipus]
MFQLAVDLPACEALGPGPEFWLLPRSPPRPPRLWSFRSGQPARVPTPVWSPRPPRMERTHGQMQVSRARRAHRPRDQAAALAPKAGLAKPPAVARSSPSIASSSSSSSSAVAGGAPEQQALLRRGKRHLQGDGLSSFDSRGSRPTTETEFIAWGPTGDEEGLESNTLPAIYGPTTVSILQTRKTTVAATTATTTATPMTLQTKGFTESLDPRRRIPGLCRIQGREENGSSEFTCGRPALQAARPSASSLGSLLARQVVYRSARQGGAAVVRFQAWAKRREEMVCIYKDGDGNDGGDSDEDDDDGDDVGIDDDGDDVGIDDGNDGKDDDDGDGDDGDDGDGDDGDGDGDGDDDDGDDVGIDDDGDNDGNG